MTARVYQSCWRKTSALDRHTMGWRVREKHARWGGTSEKTSTSRIQRSVLCSKTIILHFDFPWAWISKQQMVLKRKRLQQLWCRVRAVCNVFCSTFRSPEWTDAHDPWHSHRLLTPILIIRSSELSWIAWLLHCFIQPPCSNTKQVFFQLHERHSPSVGDCEELS